MTDSKKLFLYLWVFKLTFFSHTFIANVNFLRQPFARSPNKLTNLRRVMRKRKKIFSLYYIKNRRVQTTLDDSSSSCRSLSNQIMTPKGNKFRPIIYTKWVSRWTDCILDYFHLLALILVNISNSSNKIFKSIQNLIYSFSLLFF